jgi:hypothetical protein
VSVTIQYFQHKQYRKIFSSDVLHTPNCRK